MRKGWKRRVLVTGLAGKEGLSREGSEGVA